jgi:CHAD domain-containing protein
MWREESPLSILSNSLDTLRRQLGSIRNGDEEAVHDARTTVRRTREAVALLRECSDDDLDDLEQLLRQLGRALGDARDADVRQHLAQYAAARLRLGSNLLGVLESAIRADQLKYRRRAIKVIERLDVASLARWPGPRARVQRRCTRAALRSQLASRSTSLAELIERSGSVYFPNRLHDVRLGAKRLRYTMELSDRLNVRRPPRALRTLRSAQDLLGDLHDRETLLRLVAKTPTQNDESREAVRHFIAAEMDALHARYLALRPQLLEICHAGVRLVAGAHQRLKLLLAAGAAVNSVLIARALLQGFQQEAAEAGTAEGAESRYQPAS